MKNFKNHFHKFRENDKLKFQKNYIFFDTETKPEIDKNRTETHTLNLGWGMYWNRETNFKEWFYFENYKSFWEWVISKYNKDTKTLILYSHNMDFDSKIVCALPYLTKHNWTVDTAHFKKGSFFIHFKKDGNQLKLWDTVNYCKQPLKNIGEFVGYSKIEIDLNTASQKEIKKYCKRDVEIVYQFIKKFSDFLEKNDLSQLKPTIAGISKNCFRHKFYDKDNPIFIHYQKSTIKNERFSYRGGITDLFRVGKIKEKLYYTDINSSYPYELRNKKFPVKLIFHSNNLLKTEQELNQILNKYIDNDNYGIIANLDIELPQKYAYILVKAKVNNEDKSLFLSGRFNVGLTTPEIKFVLKHGKIIRVKELCVYKMRVIYKDFVDFFYGVKKQATIENDKVTREIAKLIMNSGYGWWATKKHTLKHISVSKENRVIKYDEKILKIGETTQTQQKIQLGYQIFLQQTNNNENAFDSFVAIASFVTSYARMSLVKFILIAERENVIYVDTDSVIVNKRGYRNLENQKVIDKYKLGYLKLEKTIHNVKVIKPKFYEYDEIKDNKTKHTLVCKGKNKKAKIIFENENFLVAENQIWESVNSGLRSGNLDKQIISIQPKKFYKFYDKGKIKENIVFPFHLKKLDGE